jgi:small-conductance mechanosensitive channel
MNDFYDVERLSGWGQELLRWVTTNVTTIDTAIQLGAVIVTLSVAYLISRALPRWLPLKAERGRFDGFKAFVIPLGFPLTWLILAFISVVIFQQLNQPYYLLDIVVSLVTAWLVIRIASRVVRDPTWSRLVAWIAWSIAALNILNLLNPAIEMLDSVALELGGLRISLYTVVSSTFALAVLLTLAFYFSRVLEKRIQTSQTLSPSLRVLVSKALRIVLIGLAILIAIRSVGIDVTALTVLGGAIGLGIGFGLQKIVGNLVSGVILLLDKSIKPGDVIGVAGTYGWVTGLGGRYVSVVTRDGIEHLIPNETLITERVENWTHSDENTRLRIPVGVHYQSDIRQAMDICIEAARSTERVLTDPAPACLLRGFGDSSVDLEVRFWIKDAAHGISNVKSEILLKIWDGLHESDIEIPYPQRDLHLRTPAHLGDSLSVRPAAP